MKRALKIFLIDEPSNYIEAIECAYKCCVCSLEMFNYNAVILFFIIFYPYIFI